MMQRVLIFFSLILILSACKAKPTPAVWTPKYEEGFYKYLDSVSKPTMPDEAKRSKFVSFLISRLKEEIPNGLNSVSKDSLHNLNIRLSREYTEKQYGEGNHDIGINASYTPWTPMIEKTFRDDFFAIFKNRGAKMTNEFCDCVIEKLKKIYPDSILIPVPKKIMEKTVIGCKNETDLN